MESTVGIGTQLGGVMKSLGAAALNMGVSFLAGMAISAVIKAYDNYVNRVKYAKEALQNSLDAYDSAGNEVKDLTQQLKECEAQMRELEGTNGITIVSDEQYQRLKETKAELEAQLKIKQAEQQIAAMQAANDARDLYRQGFDSGVDDSTGGASAHRDPYAQDHGPTANERQSPDKALNEAIADYNEKASTKKDVDADLLKVSDEMNKMTDKQSSAYGELVEQYNDLMDQSKEYSSQLADSAQNIQGLYSAVEQVINGYDVYMAAGGQLLPYEQIIYNSLKKSSDGFLDFADSLGVATDAEEENALAAVGLARSYTMSSSDMDTLKTEVDEVCSSYESLNAALTAQTTGKSVTLTDDLKQYANCLEYTNGVMQLNTERVRELAKAKADDKLATIAAYEEQERYQYSQNSTTIEKYIAALGDKKQAIVDGITVTKDTIDALRRDNEQIALNAKNYELLSSQIRQATGDYQAWLAGQNAPTQGTMFTDAGNAIKAVMEGLANGKVGTEKFKSAVGFIVPDDIDSEDKAAVKKYVEKLKRYLADNGSGVSNFINDAVKKGLMTGSAAKGADIVEGTRIQDFVDKLGLTEEVVRAIFGELETYGSKFDWSLEGLEDLDDALFEARTQYDNLRNDLEKQGIKVDVDDTDVKNAETALKKLSQYGNVDLTNRPQISADKMQAAGYTDFKDGYVAYIVNKHGDAYYVSKLDEGNTDVNYDTLGNRPIDNLVGTLDKFVIVSELSDGVYKIRGQYKICLGDATVYSSANDNFFLVGHSDGAATIRKITSSDIFDYTVMDNAIASESSIPTKKWLAEQKYATESYVDAKLAAMNFITKEEVSDYVADAISKNLESLIDQQIETKLNERLTSAEASDITNLF